MRNVFLVICLSLCACNSSRIVTDNQYEKSYIITGRDSLGITNTCTLDINYPTLFFQRNKYVEKQINNQLKKVFIKDDFLSTCIQDDDEDTFANTEINYTYYLTDKLLSVLATETFSSNLAAGTTIEAHNFDIKSGKALTTQDLFQISSENEIVIKILSHIFLENSTGTDAQEQYKIYLGMADYVFNNLQVQVLETKLAIYFKGISGMEPYYKTEIEIKEMHKYLNKKYF